MNQTKIIIKFFYLSLILSLSFLSFIIFYEIKTDNLFLYVLDVGQGDAILIRTPEHKNILIDGGPDNSVIYGLGKYLPFYNRTIDLMILTHPDSDHVLGLNEVLNRYQVKAVLLTGIDYSSAAYRHWLKSLAANQVQLIVAGDVNYLKIDNKTSLAIFYPFQSLGGQKFEELNQTSIVTKLFFNNSTILLTGDTTVEIENEMIKKNLNLKADVLKVAHHGSDTSSSEFFIKAVSPQLALISVGQDNKFGHPKPVIIERFKQFNIPLITTQQEGDIILEFNQDGFKGSPHTF